MLFKREIYINCGEGGGEQNQTQVCFDKQHWGIFQFQQPPMGSFLLCEAKQVKNQYLCLSEGQQINYSQHHILPVIFNLLFRAHR